MKSNLTPYPTCPHCGREYVKEEIFVKEDFFGNPDIVRDAKDRRIDEEFGKVAKLTSDEFICEACGKPFTVKAHIQYESIKPAIDFKEDF